MSLPLYDRVLLDFAVVFGKSARPVAPFPASACPTRDLPESRDDFTRDSEATGA